MKISFVDLKRQYVSIKTEIDKAIGGVCDQVSFVGGPIVREFETQFKELIKASNCIGVANGTDALYIAMKMLGIGHGDEVITTASSWISTSETITQTGAKPVFVDIDPDYYTINPRLIEEKINSNTKAILPVHLYGQSAHIIQIKNLCDKYNLYLIEDCAQAHLTKENGKCVGTFGNAGTFSFYPGKNLGAYGDAGAIVTNDQQLATQIRMFANHGALVKHHHEIEGINSRLDTIQAAILSVKMKYLLDWTEQRIKHAKLYSELLSTTGDIIIPKVREGTTHTFHLYVIRTDRRDALKEFLESRGIQTAIHYPRILPNLPAYKYLELQLNEFPVGTAYQKTILSLPMFPELSIREIEFICAQVKKFFS